MLVADIDVAVVAAATRTPFEARRRVFVIERAETMGESTANRMLKTLEEPPEFVHLILLSARPGEVLETVASRCQLVRFEVPSVEQLAVSLEAQGVGPEAAQACSRLALGDAERAAALALGEGPELRAAAEHYATSALRGELNDRPWAALLELAGRAGAAATSEIDTAHAAELEQLPRSERARSEREHEERRKRAERRHERTILDLALATAGLCYRDAAVLASGADELVYATDRRTELRALAAAAPPARLQQALALVENGREALAINATEELALEALAYRIAALQ
jgi:DNA polymerase-3 subunit delta'